MVLRIVALLLAVPALAFAGGGVNNPEFVRKHQGEVAAASQVSCTTISAQVISGDGNRRAWSVAIETGALYICCDTTLPLTAPPTPTPAACTTATAGIFLSTTTGRTSYTNETSAKLRCRCITATGTVTAYIQEWK